MKVTIKDIAEQANVSTATVSKVLNKNDLSISKATRERVLKVVKRNNYIPNAMAKGLKSCRSNMIGFILPDITNPFFPAAQSVSARFPHSRSSANSSRATPRSTMCFW